MVCGLLFTAAAAGEGNKPVAAALEFCGLWFYGLWFYGLWFMVYGGRGREVGKPVAAALKGLWFMVHGLWCMVYGGNRSRRRSRVYGLWFMAYGLWG